MEDEGTQEKTSEGPMPGEWRAARIPAELWHSIDEWRLGFERKHLVPLSFSAAVCKLATERLEQIKAHAESTEDADR